MKYTLEEKMDIGRRMYEHKISYKEVMATYGISKSFAHKCQTDYKKANNIPLSGSNSIHQQKNVILSTSSPDIDSYLAMSKEELINELIRAKANELRAKKGYEVKGVGVNKEFISLSNKNTKS